MATSCLSCLHSRLHCGFQTVRIEVQGHPRACRLSRPAPMERVHSCTTRASLMAIGLSISSRVGVIHITAFEEQRQFWQRSHAGPYWTHVLKTYLDIMPLPISALSLAREVYCFQPPASFLQGVCLGHAQERSHIGALYSSRVAASIPYYSAQMAIRDSSICLKSCRIVCHGLHSY